MQTGSVYSIKYGKNSSSYGDQDSKDKKSRFNMDQSVSSGGNIQMKNALNINKESSGSGHNSGKSSGSHPESLRHGSFSSQNSDTMIRRVNM